MPDTGLHTHSHFHLLTGKRIRTQQQIQREISLKRVSSHEKISFSIRKMDSLFRKQPTQPTENQRQPYPLRKEIKEKKEKKEKKDDRQLGPLRNDKYQIQRVIRNGTNLFQNNPQSQSKVRLMSYKQDIIKIINEDIPGLTFKNERKKGKDSDCEYIHLKQLLKTQSEVVHEVYNMRQTQSLLNKPKQWQFHNLLNLQKIELYRTNLKLSCQSWVLIDSLELKYLRGWGPKVQMEFTPLLRLFVADILLSMEGESEIDLSKTAVRLNHENIHDKMKEDDVKGAHIYSLANHCIVTLQDLLIGMLMTVKIDIVWHLVYAIGHISQAKKEAREISNCIFLEYDADRLERYERIFIQLCEQIALKHHLANTHFIPTTKPLFRATMNKLIHQRIFSLKTNKYFSQVQEIVLKSTALDMAVMFMVSLKRPLFREVYSSSRGHPFTMRHQMGFKYWEDRKHVWAHEHRQLRSLGYNGITDRLLSDGTQCTVVYHQCKDVTVLVAGSKVNMHMSDLTKIDQWMDQTFHRLSPERRSSNKKSP